MTRIAVLVSGGGTNLQALLEAQQRGGLPGGEIVLVIFSSGRPMRWNGLPRRELPRRWYPARNWLPNCLT